jgi:hypothetical protein
VELKKYNSRQVKKKSGLLSDDQNYCYMLHLKVEFFSFCAHMKQVSRYYWSVKVIHSFKNLPHGYDVFSFSTEYLVNNLHSCRKRQLKRRITYNQFSRKGFNNTIARVSIVHLLIKKILITLLSIILWGISLYVLENKWSWIFVHFGTSQYISQLRVSLSNNSPDFCSRGRLHHSLYSFNGGPSTLMVCC